MLTVAATMDSGTPTSQSRWTTVLGVLALVCSGVFQKWGSAPVNLWWLHLVGFVPAAAPEIDVERHGFGVRAFLRDNADSVAECVRLKLHLGVAHFVRVPAHSR